MKKVMWVVFCTSVIVFLFLRVKRKEDLQASTVRFSDSLQVQRLLLPSGKERIARIKKGDTLVMTYQELVSLLPASLETYRRTGSPGSSLVNLMGNQYRVAEQVYQKGKRKLKVAIVDYNAAYTLYNVATATFESGVAIDNNEQTVQRIDLGDEEVKGWETFDKRENKATVYVGIAERFLITIEATNQNNIQELEKIIKDMDLEEFTCR